MPASSIYTLNSPTMGIQTCFGGACDGDSAVLRCFVCGDVGAAIMFTDEESYDLISLKYDSRCACVPRGICFNNKIIVVDFGNLLRSSIAFPSTFAYVSQSVGGNAKQHWSPHSWLKHESVGKL